MPQIISLVIILGLMYFLLIRPQQQRVKAHRALLDSLNVGDEVVTAGGLIGRIRGFHDEAVDLELAEGVVIQIVRLGINSRRSAPSIESSEAGGE